MFWFYFSFGFFEKVEKTKPFSPKVYFSVSNPLLCNCWLWPRTMCALLILGLNTEIWNNSTIIQHIYDLKLNEERKEKEEMLFEFDKKLLILKYYCCGTFLHFQHWSIWDIYFEMGTVEYLDLTLSVRWYCGRLYVLIQVTLIALWEGQYKMIQITIQSVYIFQQNVIDRPQLPLLQLARQFWLLVPRIFIWGLARPVSMMIDTVGVEILFMERRHQSTTGQGGTNLKEWQIWGTDRFQLLTLSQFWPHLLQQPLFLLQVVFLFSWEDSWVWEGRHSEDIWDGISFSNGILDDIW